MLVLWASEVYRSLAPQKRAVADGLMALAQLLVNPVKIATLRCDDELQIVTYDSDYRVDMILKHCDVTIFVRTAILESGLYF